MCCRLWVYLRSAEVARNSISLIVALRREITEARSSICSGTYILGRGLLSAFGAWEPFAAEPRLLRGLLKGGC